MCGTASVLKYTKINKQNKSKEDMHLINSLENHKITSSLKMIGLHGQLGIADLT